MVAAAAAGIGRVSGWVVKGWLLRRLGQLGGGCCGGWDRAGEWLGGKGVAAAAAGAAWVSGWV
eukprot:350275-Chlamydomonas_euryale.AAC.5